MRRRIFDEDHDLFRASARAFVEREMVPHYEKWERTGIVDKELFRRAGAAGLLGTAVPEEYGGGGVADFRFNAVLLEEVCRAGVMSAGLGISTHSDVVVPYFVRYGTADQKERWLPGLCSGELVGAVAMTEPGTGSDLAAIRTTAVRTADGYLVNGAKTYISNGINSDVVVVVARAATGAGGTRDLNLVVVETGTPGFERGRNLDKVGQKAADTAELFFDDVVVPSDHLLGEEGRGFYQLMAMLPQERLSIAVMALAHAEAAFTDTLEYCKERQAFGRPIGSFQNSRFVLATMRTELDLGRAFVDAQLEAHAAGELTAEEAAESKWWCAELNRRVLDGCLQLHGGFGYMEESRIGRAWRDGRAMSIYGGTNEIMKEIVGRRMLGL